MTRYHRIPLPSFEEWVITQHTYAQIGRWLRLFVVTWLTTLALTGQAFSLRNLWAGLPATIETLYRQQRPAVPLGPQPDEPPPARG